MDPRRHWPVLVAAFVVAWALASARSQLTGGMAGFTTNGDSRVTAVMPGSPAERAGLRPGDRLLGYQLSTDDDLQPVGAVPANETRVLRVQRDDQTLGLTVRFAQRAGVHRWRPLGFIVIGLSLPVVAGVALHRRPGRLTRVLFIAGAGIGLACLGEPEFTNPAWRAAFMAARNALVLAGLGAMVQFMLEYTQPGRRAHWVYVPLAAYWLVLDWRLLAPGATALAGVTGVLGGALLVLALSVILVAVCRGWIRGRARDEPRGIRPVFYSTMGGLALLLLSATLERAWSFRGLVDAVGALVLLVVVLAWGRAALLAQAPAEGEGVSAD